MGTLVQANRHRLEAVLGAEFAEQEAVGHHMPAANLLRTAAEDSSPATEPVGRLGVIFPPVETRQKVLVHAAVRMKWAPARLGEVAYATDSRGTTHCVDWPVTPPIRS